MFIRRLMAMAAGGLVLTLATGQRSPLQAQEGATVEADVDIVREVNARNLAEIRMGEITRKMTTDEGVRRFGDLMIADHSNMHRQWSALVGKDGKPFRTGLGDQPALNAEVRRIEKLPGNQFDREYLAAMIRHHEENVRFFQDKASSARSTQVRELLTSGLPVLQQHLNLAVQEGRRYGLAPAVATGGQGVPPNVPVATPNVPAQNAPVAGQNWPVTNKKDRDDFKKDGKFVREAIADNTLEIRLAQVAETKTTDPAVRQLAKRVLDDRTVMQSRWLALASRHGLNLKAGMGPRHRDKVKRMEKTSGGDFDRAYPTMLIQSNQDYVEYFQKEGRATQSSQVRSLAASDLVTLRQHLSQAKQVGSQHGVDTTAALRARNLSSYRNYKK